MRPISACSVAVVVAAAAVVGVALATVVAVQKNKFLKITSYIKGQLISKCLFGVIVWTKITTKKFDKSCPTHSRAESVNFFRCYFGPNEQKNILKLIDL